MKILSTKAHGILDYLTGIVLLTLPWIAGFSDIAPAKWTMVFVGAMVIVMSLLTDYESGLIRRITMPMHLNIDLVTGLLFAASPWIFGFADQVYLPHLALGLFQTVASLATSRRAHDSVKANSWG